MDIRYINNLNISYAFYFIFSGFDVGQSQEIGQLNEKYKNIKELKTTYSD